jgi:hypothetical protein
MKTKRYYSGASRRGAEQTPKRARRKQRERERERLTRLGADPAWLDRVLPNE